MILKVIFRVQLFLVKCTLNFILIAQAAKRLLKSRVSQEKQSNLTLQKRKCKRIFYVVMKCSIIGPQQGWFELQPLPSKGDSNSNHSPARVIRTPEFITILSLCSPSLQTAAQLQDGLWYQSAPLIAFYSVRFTLPLSDSNKTVVGSKFGNHQLERFQVWDAETLALILFR